MSSESWPEKFPQSVPIERGICAPVQMINSALQLDEIQDQQTSLLLWRRSLPQQIQDWIAEVVLMEVDNIRFETRPKDLKRRLTKEFKDRSLPQTAGATGFIEDVTNLVAAFAGAAKTSMTQVRLKWIDGDACWKFHWDYVTHRLVTTYSGPGTEWVLPIYSRQAVAQQQAYAGPLEYLDVGDVALFKGCRNNSEDGIVHRSPPLSGHRQNRLFLCLNVARQVRWG